MKTLRTLFVIAAFIFTLIASTGATWRLAEYITDHITFEWVVYIIFISLEFGILVLILLIFLHLLKKNKL